ncbi:hypothetical protein ACOME3_006274 [Neoechinorhynchus agilis]
MSYGQHPSGYRQSTGGHGRHSFRPPSSHSEVKLSIYPFLSPSQMINIATTFNAFDQDKSGNIDRNEMLSALQSNGINADPHVVNQQMDKMDTDRDGTVSWTEFFKFMVQVLQNTSS